MIRQAFRNLSVWFFENRDLQRLRVQASKLLHRRWPHLPRHELRFATQVERAGWLWRSARMRLDINPGSGDLFVEGKYVESASEFDSLLPKGDLDLIGHIFPRRIAREPALVLYAGADVSASGFVAGVVAPFFALEPAGLPENVLLLVNMEMGRTRRFQDALIDQLFQPRPLELMRRHRIVQVEELHEVDAPFLASQHFEKARSRIAQIYGPFASEGPAVVLCSQAARRASSLIESCPPDVKAALAQGHIVLDADTTPLRLLIKSLAAARLAVVPEGDELSLLALLPDRRPSLVEVALDRPKSKLAEQIRLAAGL